MIDPDLERALEAGDARLIWRLPPFQSRLNMADPAAARRGIFLDTETTGLDSTVDEVIELAMIPFSFTVSGDILDCGEPWHSYRQPSRPISAEITTLTGITADMVAGQVISPDDVAAFIDDAHLIVAHHAEFDRLFCERLCPRFATKRWACSMDEIDWKSVGFEGRCLRFLVMQAGYFYEAHRATADCQAALQLLSEPRKMPGRFCPPFALLLEEARRPSYRVIAADSPFKRKEALKSRKYRWEPDRKVWFRDVKQATLAEEIEWLREHIYDSASRYIDRVELTALTRFSDRCWL
jgi:DNA polymerase-3 subunit epsilon